MLSRDEKEALQLLIDGLDAQERSRISELLKLPPSKETSNAIDSILRAAIQRQHSPKN